jgi:hypothetical protein
LTLMAKMQAKAMWRKCFISDVMVLVALNDLTVRACVPVAARRARSVLGDTCRYCESLLATMASRDSEAVLVGMSVSLSY